MFSLDIDVGFVGRPDISICASAVRPHLWKEFFNSVVNNNSRIEVVFVGDVEPKFHLPERFRYIYSPVKPAQCWEAAIRSARGRYITISADDAEYTPGSIDAMVRFMDTRYNIKSVGAFQTIENGSLITDSHYFKEKRMAPFFVFDRRYYKDIGGADKRFIGGMWENDIIMRVWEDGGIVEVCKESFVSVNHLLKHNATSKSCDWHWKYSLPLLESLWVNPNERADAVIPFDDKDIFEYSQGEKGDW